jgi:ABC-2 type transport system ATP-binding protein
VDTVIRVVDVSKRFTLHKEESLKERVANFRRSREHRQDFWALRNVDLEVGSASTLGLIGANGSGKSTLLKLIGGILTPTSGHVERRGRLAALLELGAGFHPDLTGRENVYLNASILGLSRAQTERYFDEIVDFSGSEPFIDSQVKFYSSGMYVRLAFAVAVHVAPEILLVDEVLAVGDEPFQRKCLDRIKKFQSDGRTIVLVTHSLDQVRQLCDRVVLLDGGRVAVDGTPADAVRHFREANAAQETLEQESREHVLRIEHVRVVDDRGRPVSTIESGSPLTIDYDVVAEHPVDDWAAGIALTDGTGLVLHGTNTVLQGLELAPVTGRHTVRFAFDVLPLVEGQYWVTAAVHPAVGPDYHRVERGASFQVSSRSLDAGVVALSPKIEVR